MRSGLRASLLFLALTVSIFADEAAALNFFELEAYRAGTRGRGAMYVESFSSVVARGSRSAEGRLLPTEHLVRSSLEMNYGLTDLVDLALYLDTAKPEGRDVRYGGLRLRARGPIAQTRLPFDVGWYAELELPRREFADEDAAVELRGIVSREWGAFSLRLNPTLEQALNGDEADDGPGFQYAARAGYEVYGPVALALEGFGDTGSLHEIGSHPMQHYLLPLIRVEPTASFEVAVGPGFGLTRSSDDLFVKLVLEYKFILNP